MSKQLPQLEASTNEQAVRSTAVKARRARKPGANWLALLPGLFIVIAIGLISYWLSRWLSSALSISLDTLIIALILGIGLKNLLPQPEPANPHAVTSTAEQEQRPNNVVYRTNIAGAEHFIPGAQLGIKIMVPLAIILYGANLDISRLITLPGPVIIITLLGMGLFYVLIYWLNRVLWKMPTRLNELIATGSAICGASAIVVLSPSIDAEPEETSTSLLAITAVGLLALMVYPILKSTLNLSDNVYAVLSGATLHQTGLVQAAIANLDQTAAAYALAVKTLRIVMLAPVAIVSGLLHLWDRKAVTANAENRHSSANSAAPAAPYPRLAWTRPLARVWFLLPFVVMGLLTSFVPAVRDFMLSLKTVESIVFAIALASIGFAIDIESVIRAGSKPVLVALVGWVGVVLFFIFVAPFLIA